MIGVHHPDMRIVFLGQQGGVVLPQVMAVDQIDPPLGTQGRQVAGRLVVEAAAHLHTPAGYAHLLQPLHQQAALMIGKKGLDQSVGREIVHRSLHIPLRPRLPGEVEQIEHLRHRRIPPFSHSRRGLPIRVSHSTGNRRGNQPAFQTAKARRSCGGPLCFDFLGRSKSALRQGFASQNACTRRRRGALARPVAREGPVELRPPFLTGSS